MVLDSFAPDLPDPAFLARSALRERFEDELRVEIGECDGLRFSLDDERRGDLANRSLLPFRRGELL